MVAAGQAEFLEGEHALGDYVILMPTPGQTPGPVSIRIKRAGKEAVITGDAIHSRAQYQNPHWQFKFDYDVDLAVTSRRTMLETSTELGLTVLGTHFTLPFIGRIDADGDVFRWMED